MLEIATNIVTPQEGPEWQRLRHEDLSDIPLDNLSIHITTVLKGMLRRHPHRRLTIDEILENPIICLIDEWRTVGRLDEVSGQLEKSKGSILPESEDYLEKILEVADLNENSITEKEIMEVDDT
jgi:hypothetical protein